MLIPRYGRTIRPANIKHIGSNPKPDRAREIEAMLQQGIKPKEVADILGIRPSTLSDFMKRWGIKKP